MDIGVIVERLDTARGLVDRDEYEELVKKYHAGPTMKSETWHRMLVGSAMSLFDHVLLDKESSAEEGELAATYLMASIDCMKHGIDMTKLEADLGIPSLRLKYLKRK